jgi:hypothetical protein
VRWLLVAVVAVACRTQPFQPGPADFSSVREFSSAHDLARPPGDLARTCPDPQLCRPGGSPCIQPGDCCTGLCVDGICTVCRNVGESCSAPCECCQFGVPCAGGACPLGPA